MAYQNGQTDGSGLQGHPLYRNKVREFYQPPQVQLQQVIQPDPEPETEFDRWFKTLDETTQKALESIDSIYEDQMRRYEKGRDLHHPGKSMDEVFAVTLPGGMTARQMFDADFRNAVESQELGAYYDLYCQILAEMEVEEITEPVKPKNGVEEITEPVKPKNGVEEAIELKEIVVGAMGNVMNTGLGHVFLLCLWTVMLFIDWFTNKWSLLGPVDLADVMSSGSFWHGLFALIVMPTEIYFKVVRMYLNQTDPERVNVIWLLKGFMAVIIVAMVYDGFATFLPPVNMVEGGDEMSRIGGIVVGAILTGITTVASFKILDELFIVIVLVRRRFWKQKNS